LFQDDSIQSRVFTLIYKSPSGACGATNTCGEGFEISFFRDLWFQDRSTEAQPHPRKENSPKHSPRTIGPDPWVERSSPTSGPENDLRSRALLSITLPLGSGGGSKNACNEDPKTAPGRPGKDKGCRGLRETRPQAGFPYLPANKIDEKLMMPREKINLTETLTREPTRER
jgi:hypothetical protein